MGIFSKNKKIDSWVKKMDKIVTWIIIGSAIASIFWLSQTKKWKEISHEISSKSSQKITSFSKWLFDKISKLFSKK